MYLYFLFFLICFLTCFPLYFSQFSFFLSSFKCPRPFAFYPHLFPNTNYVFSSFVPSLSLPSCFSALTFLPSSILCSSSLSLSFPSVSKHSHSFRIFLPLLHLPSNLVLTFCIHSPVDLFPNTSALIKYVHITCYNTSCSPLKNLIQVQFSATSVVNIACKIIPLIFRLYALSTLVDTYTVKSMCKNKMASWCVIDYLALFHNLQLL